MLKAQNHHGFGLFFNGLTLTIKIFTTTPYPLSAIEQVKKIQSVIQMVTKQDYQYRHAKALLLNLNRSHVITLSTYCDFN